MSEEYSPEYKLHQDFAQKVKQVLTSEWKSTRQVIKEITGNPDKNGWRDWDVEYTKNVLRSMSDVEVIPEWLESREQYDKGGKRIDWRLNE